jgi:hypothetical protein
MSNLDFVTTKELFTEISLRCDSYLFCGYVDRDERHYVMTYESKGNGPEIVGLGCLLQQHVIGLVGPGGGD